MTMKVSALAAMIRDLMAGIERIFLSYEHG
jgi:hypothetical protein